MPLKTTYHSVWRDW